MSFLLAFLRPSLRMVFSFFKKEPVVSQSFSITLDELRRLCPRGKRDILEGVVRHSALMADYGLDKNRLRLCHFLAQAAHETAGFRTLVEYGSSRYFRARYGHRRDLGNRTASDGARFRGRGIFQLTGRDNYRRYGRFLRIDLENRPFLAASPEISLRIACEYWRRNGLNHLADRNDLRAITRRINGGFNGLRDRQRYFNRALSIWRPGAKPLAPPAVLQSGDRGAGVRRLQKGLRSLGARIRVDGLFGPRTRRALVNFQKRHGLRPDGLYGPRSRRAMRALVAARRNVPQAGSPSRSPIEPKKTEKEIFMTQWKSYLSSRTIWANIIGFTALALDMLGFNGVSAADQSELVDQLLKLIEAGAFVAAIFFRAIARDRLGPSIV